MIFFLIFLFLFGINVSQVNNASACSVNMDEINSQNMLFELNEAEDKENFASSVSTDSGQSEDQIQNNQEKEEIPVVNSHNIDSTHPFEEKKLETVDLSNTAGINQEKKEILVNSHNIDGTPPFEEKKLETVDLSNPAGTNQEKADIPVHSKLINFELFNNSFFKNKEKDVDRTVVNYFSETLGWNRVSYSFVKRLSGTCCDYLKETIQNLENGCDNEIIKTMIKNKEFQEEYQKFLQISNKEPVSFCYKWDIKEYDALGNEFLIVNKISYDPLDKILEFSRSSSSNLFSSKDTIYYKIFLISSLLSVFSYVLYKILPFIKKIF